MACSPISRWMRRAGCGKAELDGRSGRPARPRRDRHASRRLPRSCAKQPCLRERAVIPARQTGLRRIGNLGARPVTAWPALRPARRIVIGSHCDRDRGRSATRALWAGSVDKFCQQTSSLAGALGAFHPVDTATGPACACALAAAVGPLVNGTTREDALCGRAERAVQRTALPGLGCAAGRCDIATAGRLRSNIVPAGQRGPAVVALLFRSDRECHIRLYRARHRRPSPAAADKGDHMCSRHQRLHP